MRIAPGLGEAYRTETEQLTAGRIPQAVAIFLSGAAVFGVFESVLYPAAAVPFFGLYLLAAAVTVPLVLLRHGLMRRRRMVSSSIAAAVVLSLLPYAQTLWVAPPMELVGISVVCVVTAMALALPWGVRGQAVVALVNVIGYAGAVSVNGAVSTSPVILLFVVSAGAAMSVLGAHYLDLYRFTIFREITQSEEEAAINRTLVHIAREINASLDPRSVLDRIAASTRAALRCDWSVILLWDERRNAFRVAGGAGDHPEAYREVSAFEFSPATFPLMEHILSDEYLEIPDRSATDAVSAGFLQRWYTNYLQSGTLMCSGSVVGILAAGGRHAGGAFSQRTRQLFRGIAQHAAIALNNVRLVADLRHADRLKSEFVSAMSHELRTPLNVIMGYTDLLMAEDFGPLHGEQQDILGRVHESACTLLELVNETLDVSRLDAGRSPVLLREVSIRAFMEEVERETSLLPRKPEVDLRWDLRLGYDRVRTDPNKLKIILKNLIGNALKFTDAGHVAVRVHYDRRTGALQLQVAVTGSGIPGDDLPHIFDMFRQGGNGPDHGGVGLGLYILKRFVEQLQGEASVTSVPGEGSTFTVSIPAASVAQETAGSDDTQRPTQSPRARQHARVQRLPVASAAR